jgi:hypothetical protein
METRQVRIMPGEHDVARVAAEPVAHPLRSIVRLEILRRRKLRKRIARAPEGFCGLPCAKLAAVPDDGRLDAECSGIYGETVDGFTSPWRQRAPRINLWSDRVAVMNEKHVHAGILERGLGARGSKKNTMRIRGWLLVLCALLLVWQPLNLALTISGGIDRLTLRGPGFALVLVARLFAAGVGIAAGLSLFQRRPGAVEIAKASLIFSATVDVAIYLTPYSSNNRPPGDATIVLAASLVYYAAWFAYLVRSQRVRATFDA